MNTRYLYLCCSLKDSFVTGAKFVVAFDNGPYIHQLSKSISKLSGLTSRSKLTTEYDFIPGEAGAAVQLRLVIGVPPGWSSDRFKEIAEREFAHNPSVDMIIYSEVHHGPLDLKFKEHGYRLLRP